MRRKYKQVLQFQLTPLEQRTEVLRQERMAPAFLRSRLWLYRKGIRFFLSDALQRYLRNRQIILKPA